MNLSITLNPFGILILIALLPAMTGCKVFLPAHKNSNHRAGEKVIITPLDHDAMTGSNYWKEYQSAFGFKPSKPEPAVSGGQRDPVTASAVAAAAIGFAVDYVKKELQQEATLYEAQFRASDAYDNFWILTTNGTTQLESAVTRKTTERIENRTVGTNTEPRIRTEVTEVVTEKVRKDYGGYRQNYFGIEIQRLVGGKPALKAVIGLAPSSDQQFFAMAPLSFQTWRTKAKILSDRTITYFAPWNWPGKLMKTHGHHVNTTLSIEMDGYWKTQPQEAHITKLTATEFQFQGYDISDCKEWTASGREGDGTKLSQKTAGWLLGVPISILPNGNMVQPATGYAGTFAIRVLVTEKDPSNAKEDLEKAAKLLEDNKAKIVELTK